jgi:large subunit ribosomal protein L17
MRHGKKNNHLGRTASHRKSLLSNLANSLILNKRIVTTLAKAKELRKYVEPLLTKSKDDSTHNRRIVFSYLKNKESIKTLFGDVSEKIATRNGGYTRIIKLGTRAGDAAETAMIELVDYNELLLAVNAEKPVKTRRSRRSSGTGSAAASAPVAAAIMDSISDAQVVDDVPASEEVSEPSSYEAPIASEENATETSEEAPASAEDSSSEEPAAASDEESQTGGDESPEAPAEDAEEKPEA